MILKSIFSFLFILLLVLIAQAGPHRIGNGGNGVANSTNNSVYLLDFYEAGIENEAFFNNQVPTLFIQDVEAVLPSDLFPTKLIAGKISEIYAVDRITAASLITSLRMFNWFFVNYDLEKTTDIATSINIAPDQLLQIANRRYGQVLINKTHWSKMSAQNQAGLVLHELIYSLALKEDISDAQINLISRSVVGKIFSRNFEKVSSLNFQNIACTILPCIKNQLALTGLALLTDYQNLNQTLPASIQDTSNKVATLASIETMAYATAPSYILESTDQQSLALESALASLCKTGTKFLSVSPRYQVIQFSLDKINFGYIKWQTEVMVPSMIGTQADVCNSADAYKNLFFSAQVFFKPYWETK